MDFWMIFLLLTPPVLGRLQTYSYNYEDFVIFNNIDHDNNILYLELDEGFDILFLENVTDPSLYRIEFYKDGEKCHLINIYDDAEGGGKLKDYSRKFCPEDGVKGKILKLNWDSTKVTIHHEDKTLFHFSNEIKFPKVHHISIRPKFSSQINYKNTYTFIARLGESCTGETEPVVVCNLEMVGKSDNVKGLFLRADFYKSKNDDDFEIKARLDSNQNDSFLAILRNNDLKLWSVVLPVLNRKINLIVDLKRHHTSIHNPQDTVPLILWNEEDASYLESFNYVVVQNLKIHNSTFSEINNSNNCQIKCFEKFHTNGWWDRAKTFFKSGLKVHNYCNNTDYLRE